MFLLFGAFIAGLLTVLAPCVLPLLPIIIGGSVSGNAQDKKRPLLITGSLAVSLIVFTLLLKASTLLINIPPQTIRYFSGGIIIALGLVTFFPGLYANIIGRLGIERRAQEALGKGFQTKGELAGPILTGAALGPVFSSCSPVYAYILATVLPANFLQALAYIIAYVLGLSLVLLAVGNYGQLLTSRIRFASNPKGWFQRTIAVLFIVTGLLVFTGYDKSFQTWVSVHTPFNFDAMSAQFLPDNQNITDSSKLLNTRAYPAPEFSGINNWVNSSPLTLKQLRGKVVLLDFWTYSCINCIRNNVYLEKWYNAYKDDGLVIVGVHAPEFAFEQVLSNVQGGVRDQHITYPVALDNQLVTWNAYNNRSWPASYLIDKDSQVRRIHEGEGDYNEEEQAIRQLLTDAGAKLSGTMTTNGNEQVPITDAQTPETYLGTARASNYSGKPALGSGGTATYSYAPSLKLDQWSLSGKWQATSEKLIARGSSKLKFRFSAKDMYLVMGSSLPANVQVLIDGQPAKTGAGPDVTDGQVNVQQSRLYHLVSFPGFNSDSTLELSVPDGVELNAFTFGS